MPEYTVVALASVAAVFGLEAGVLGTGLLRTRAYWLAMVICFGFMIAVNGWLTKLTAPVVTYDRDATSGWLFPWDIPFEDYLFGFSLLTLTMLLWDFFGPRREARFQS